MLYFFTIKIKINDYSSKNSRKIGDFIAKNEKLLVNMFVPYKFSNE